MHSFCGLAGVPNTVSVHQPQFLGWAGYYNKIICSNLHVSYESVKFDQSGYQHRTMLVGGSWLTVPVKSHQRNKLICEIELADFDPDAVIRRLRSAYGRAPYAARLDHLYDAILCCARVPRLNGLCLVTNEAVFELLGVRPSVSHDLVPRGGDKVSKLDSVLNSYTLGTKFVYLSGSGAREYMSKDSLKSPTSTLFQKVLGGVRGDTVAGIIACEPDPLEYIRGAAIWE
jgi:hypothetical protein